MPFDEANRKSRAASCFAAAICVLTALALAGCNAANGIGQLILVDPSQYDLYHCKDLSDQWALLNKREAELRAEIDRANQTAGGKVVGVVAYSSDYQTVLTQKRLVQQKAAEKKCELKQTYQSDQTVR
jgi:predicted small secreted protein